MATTYQPRVYGIAGNSITIDSGPTGLVIENFDIDAGSTEKTLTGNAPGQPVIDVRATAIKETLSFVAEFETYVEPKTVIGKQCSFSASSDGTPAASPGITAIITGCKLAGQKESHWQYTITATQIDTTT